jgi:glycosyltransferase involved in cell wall biosynthesis
MRVLHVVPGMAARTGGVASGVVQLCLGLEEVGVATTIVSTDLAGSASSRLGGGIGDRELPEGADRLEIQLHPVHRPFRLAYSPALERALFALAPAHDIVHIHSLWLFPQFAAYRAAASACRPWIVSPEGALDPWLRRRGQSRKWLMSKLWQDAMLSGSSVLHMTTDEEARLAGDIVPSVPRVVVPNAIDVDSYLVGASSVRFRERFLGGHPGPVVMHLGRIAEKKGIDLLIQAFAEVVKSVPGALLAIVGPDDEGLTPRLHSLAQSLNVGGAVRFVQMVSGSDRIDAFAASDVWVLASHTENFGIAVVEALAARRAVVVSPEVNCAPELARQEAARVIRLNPRDLATTITELLQDPSLRAILGERGHRFAGRYDRSLVAREAAAMYGSVVRGLDRRVERKQLVLGARG